MGTRLLSKNRPVQHIAKTQVVERFDPDEDFSDVMGTDHVRFALENADSSRHYIWPHDDADDMSSKQAHVLNYQVEYYLGDDVEGAVRPKGMKGLLRKGDIIKVADHVLMSCDQARWEKRQRFEASTTRETNRTMAHARQADVTAGDHQSGWQGLEGYRVPKGQQGGSPEARK